MYKKNLKVHKTTVEIDEQLLERAVKISGAKSKRMAIENGLRALIRSINKEKLREELGTFDLDLTVADLDALRRDE
jgi:Arc/MetJ family transcription regulator